MHAFFELLRLAAPLFVLVLAGYALGLLAPRTRAMSEGVSSFVFNVAVPAMLFHLMSDLSRLPPVDARLLTAFFGSCLIVFAIGRLVAARVFALDSTAQSVFALGGVFSNNVLLGLPLAHATLGPQAVPAVALVLVFNALTLWTLVTLSVEWGRHGSLSMAGFAATARGVLRNPLVLAILCGSAFGWSGLTLPVAIEAPLALLARAAAPTALFALGLGLAEHGVRAGWPIALSITALKLIVQPLVVWLLARALGLPPLETQVVVLLGSIGVGFNVYLMSRQFKALETPVASSLVLSTALSALTTPAALALLGAGGSG